MKKLLILLSLVIGASHAAIAAPDIAPQPCDAQYWRQMSARAWMEAEREIMQNQNLIFKPDSVLAYTCFEKFIDHAAGKGGDIFVHTTYFGPEIITRGSKESMEVALQNVVATSLQSYNSGSFDYSFLGGRSEFMSGPNPNKKTFTGKVDYKQSYSCDVMSKVWKAAKCMNFVDNKNFETSDGFYPFKAIKKHGTGGKDVAGYEDTIQETRLYPNTLSCINTAGSPPTAGGSGGAAKQNLGAAGTWEEQIKLAENEDNNLYKFQEPLGKIFKEVGEKLEAGKCGQPGIKTGVKVMINGKEAHDDGVCTNPGCSYTSSGTCSANPTATGETVAP